jgi:hypothetical protein
MNANNNAHVWLGGLESKHIRAIKVPGTGIEPAHPCERQILSLLRLPIPPPGLNWVAILQHYMLLDFPAIIFLKKLLAAGFAGKQYPF